MRLIIAGGREVQADYAPELVQDAFDGLDWSDQVTEIVHGAANGIDVAAGRVFAERMVVTAYGSELGEVRQGCWSSPKSSHGRIR